MGLEKFVFGPEIWQLFFNYLLAMANSLVIIVFYVTIGFKCILILYQD